MRRLTAHLAPEGVRVGIENTFFGTPSLASPKEIQDFQAVCGLADLHLLLDTGHLNIHLAGRANASEYLRRLNLPVAEVHVSDNCGEKDEHLQLGRGVLDFADLARGLKETGFQGPITVEVCVDILRGRYAAHLDRPEQLAPILETRDRILKAL
jgi:sugar phosphate isomerase/epimerase